MKLLHISIISGKLRRVIYRLILFYSVLRFRNIIFEKKVTQNLNKLVANTERVPPINYNRMIGKINKNMRLKLMDVFLNNLLS